MDLDPPIDASLRFSSTGSWALSGPAQPQKVDAGHGSQQAARDRPPHTVPPGCSLGLSASAAYEWGACACYQLAPSPGARRSLQARRMHAAGHVEPLDDDDPSSHACSLQRRGEPARSRSDHDNVGLVGYGNDPAAAVSRACARSWHPWAQRSCGYPQLPCSERQRLGSTMSEPPRSRLLRSRSEADRGRPQRGMAPRTDSGDGATFRKTAMLIAQTLSIHDRSEAVSSMPDIRAGYQGMSRWEGRCD